MLPVKRVRAIVVDPQAEWPRVEQETLDMVGLATRYVAPLALVPTIAAFIGSSLIGMTVSGGGTVRQPVFAGLLSAAFGYVATFAAVLLTALIADVLAPRFGGQRNFASALKLAAYSFTPVWLAGIFLLIPGLRFLHLLGGYGAYLLWTGLTPLMKAPRENSPVYAAAVAGCAIVLIVLAGVAQRVLFAGPGGI